MPGINGYPAQFTPTAPSTQSFVSDALGRPFAPSNWLDQVFGKTTTPSPQPSLPPKLPGSGFPIPLGGRVGGNAVWNAFQAGWQIGWDLNRWFHGESQWIEHVNNFEQTDFCSQGGCLNAGGGVITPTCLQGITSVAPCSTPPSDTANTVYLMRWENERLDFTFGFPVLVWDMFYGSTWQRVRDGAPELQKLELPPEITDPWWWQRIGFGADPRSERGKPERPNPERPTDTDVTWGSGGSGPTVTETEFLPSPPRRREKEKKLLLRGLTPGRILGAATEVGDAADCFFNALSPKIRRPLIEAAGNKPKKAKPESKGIPKVKLRRVYGAGGQEIPLQTKMKAVWDNTNDLERWVKKDPKCKGPNCEKQTGWERAIKCLVENEAQDRAIGKFSRSVTQRANAMARRFGARGNLQLGPGL